MLYNDRAAFILQQLQLKSTVKVTEIAKSLNVSVDTVRRDLKALEEQGQLKCVHGGASLPDYMLAFSNFSILKKNAGRRLKRWNICARAA